MNVLLFSGEVPRETSYELGSPSECQKKNGKWERSPDVIDERVLIFNLKDKRLCIFTACGHTGVINAARYTKKLTRHDKIHFIMGGFHLAPTELANRINPTVQDFADLNPNYSITGHCTGAKAQTELTEKFPQQHITYGVGTLFHFD